MRRLVLALLVVAACKKRTTVAPSDADPPPAQVLGRPKPRLATTKTFGCAIRNVGSVWCWEWSLEASPIAGLPPIVELAQLTSSVVARADDGSVWTLTSTHEHTRVSDLSAVKRIAADEDTVCGLKWSDELTCVELQKGTPPKWWSGAKPLPPSDGHEVRKLSLLPGAVDLSMGKDLLCTLGSSGDVDCIGESTEEGMFGLVVRSTSLQRVPDASPADAINLLHASWCVRRRGGIVRCEHPRTAPATDTYLPDLGNYPEWSLSPSILSDGTTPSEASSADGFACVRLVDVVRCFGTRRDGALPVGAAPDRAGRRPIVGVNDAIGLAVGPTSSCARRASGKVSCWGWGGIQSAIPVDVPQFAGAIGLAVGDEDLCAVLATGAVRCRRPMWNGATFIDVPGLASAVQVASGGKHFCARDTRGEVWCWSYQRDGNDHGQLGDVTLPSDQPRHVDRLRARNLVLGREKSCAVTLDDHVECWGSRLYPVDRVANGRPWRLPLSGSARQLALGERQCVGLADQEWWCDGTWQAALIVSPRPDFPAGPRQLAPEAAFSKALAVSMRPAPFEPSWTCLLPSSGDVTCDVTDAIDGYTKRRVVFTSSRAVESGNDHICVLKLDGSVQCAGSNALGQLGDGTMGIEVHFPT